MTSYDTFPCFVRKIITSVATWALMITSIYLPITATILKLTNPGSPRRQTLGRSIGKYQDWAEVERSTLSVSSAISGNSGLNERAQGSAIVHLPLLRRTQCG